MVFWMHQSRSMQEAETERYNLETEKEVETESRGYESLKKAFKTGYESLKKTF